LEVGEESVVAIHSHDVLEVGEESVVAIHSHDVLVAT
jgi:hypothetical protein